MPTKKSLIEALTAQDAKSAGFCTRKEAIDALRSHNYKSNQFKDKKELMAVLQSLAVTKQTNVLPVKSTNPELRVHARAVKKRDPRKQQKKITKKKPTKKKLNYDELKVKKEAVLLAPQPRRATRAELIEARRRVMPPTTTTTTTRIGPQPNLAALFPNRIPYYRVRQ